MGLGPFDLTGNAFLVLYGALLLCTVVASVLVTHWLRPEGRRGRSADPDALAYLAAGTTRFVDALVARLLARGAIAMVSKGAFGISAPGARTPETERGVLTLDSPASWKAVQRAAAGAAPAIEQRLVRDELLIDGVTALRLRLWQTTPYLLLLVFGSVKWVIGTMRDRPVGYLTLLLILTAVLAAIRLAVVDRRTRGGIAVLAEARDGAERLSRAPVADETGLAVALFGTAVLSGSAWSAYHTMRSSSGGDGGSDGGSGCGGGGDGGGGGCGGCGS